MLRRHGLARLRKSTWVACSANHEMHGFELGILKRAMSSLVGLAIGNRKLVEQALRPAARRSELPRQRERKRSGDGEQPESRHQLATGCGEPHPVRARLQLGTVTIAGELKRPAAADSLICRRFVGTLTEPKCLVSSGDSSKTLG